MRPFLRQLALGLPLAVGALLTLFGVTVVVQGGNRLVSGLVCALIGIPVLYATLARLDSSD
jgi:hypothetical protein